MKICERLIKLIIAVFNGAMVASNHLTDSFMLIFEKKKKKRLKRIIPDAIFGSIRDWQKKVTL